MIIFIKKHYYNLSYRPSDCNSYWQVVQEKNLDIKLYVILNIIEGPLTYLD